MLLEQYVKAKLLENFQLSNYNQLVSDLEDKCRDIIARYPNAPQYQLYSALHSVVRKNGLKMQGSPGGYREAYSLKGADWVLKMSREGRGGAYMNRTEVEISEGKHSSGARDMFVDVYDYDKLNDVPYWMICQKAVPLDNVSDLNTLKKVFPTFFSVLEDHNHWKSWELASFISDILLITIRTSNSRRVKQTSIKDLSNIEKEMFDYKLKHLDAFFAGEDIGEEHSELDRKYNKKKSEIIFPSFSKENLYSKMSTHHSNPKLVPFKDVVFGEDFERFAIAFGYIKTGDLHGGNIAIISSNNPSPSDIVIIDFDIYI